MALILWPALSSRLTFARTVSVRPTSSRSGSLRPMTRPQTTTATTTTTRMSTSFTRGCMQASLRALPVAPDHARGPAPTRAPWAADPRSGPPSHVGGTEQHAHLGGGDHRPGGDAAGPHAVGLGERHGLLERVGQVTHDGHARLA